MIDKTLVERLREEAKIAREERGLPVYTPEKIEKLADAIEHEYLPRPRLDNGEPVQVGDHFTWAGDRRDLKVSKIQVMVSWNNDTDSANAEYFERKAKLPDPEVLDADDMPIRKGDTVWYEGERYRVTDAYMLDGEDSGVDLESFSTVLGEPTKTITNAWNKLVTHKQPDSLERIEEDAKLDTCVYFGHDQSTCDGCIMAEKKELPCDIEKSLDLLNRQREVLERNHER